MESHGKQHHIRRLEELEPLIPILTHRDLPFFVRYPLCQVAKRHNILFFSLHMYTTYFTEVKKPLVVKHILILYTTKKTKVALPIKLCYSALTIGLGRSDISFIYSERTVFYSVFRHIAWYVVSNPIQHTQWQHVTQLCPLEVSSFLRFWKAQDSVLQQCQIYNLLMSPYISAYK